MLKYYHPFSAFNSFQESVSIYGGTSNVAYLVNDTKVVEIVQHSQEGHLLHLTLGARGVGGAVIAIEDVGLNLPIAASVVVKYFETLNLYLLAVMC